MKRFIQGEQLVPESLNQYRPVGYRQSRQKDEPPRPVLTTPDLFARSSNPAWHCERECN